MTLGRGHAFSFLTFWERYPKHAAAMLAIMQKDTWPADLKKYFKDHAPLGTMREGKPENREKLVQNIYELVKERLIHYQRDVHEKALKDKESDDQGPRRS